MTRQARHAIIWAAAATSILSQHERASAWDSQQDGHTPILGEENWAPTSLAGQFRMQVLKDAIGSHSDSAGNRIEKLLRCRASILGPGGTVDPDCILASRLDVDRAKAGWLTARVGGDLSHWSEHTLITRAAAERAGLLHGLGGSGPLIFEPFWLRYPARNALVGSNIRPSEPPPPNAPPPDLLVGQSFRPLALNESNAAFVARNISLLELSQLPDFSNSLADWAMGNEVCPIAGVDHAYKSDDVEACHQFTAVMGAVNVTHFRPLNHDLWQHYHGLALAAMGECRSYSGIKDAFYGYAAQELAAMSENNTEAHDCERFAMAYEMFAQHFLQDAWSSGHMWMPWGSPRFSDFPAGVDVIPDDSSPEFGPRSESARRATIAAMIGAVRGMIHGAKALTTSLVRDRSWLPNSLTRLNAFDDPLNGGIYTFQNTDGEYVDRDVLWRGAGGTLAPGAGDRFWDPATVSGAVVSQQPTYLRQRAALLDCAAKSMLEVYAAGPRAHGHELPAESTLDGVDPSSDYCWTQWATNESMLGSMGPANLRFFSNLSTLGSTLGLINDAVFDEAQRAVVDYPADLADERALFKDRLMARLTSDIGQITQVYMANAVENPDGIQSSQQHSFRDQSSAARITLLGVSPMEPSQTSGAPRDVDYVDRGPPTFSSTEAELALSRMFWRGDLKTTCRLGGLEELKQKCVLASTLGGDPDACTQCVALAELHIPQCADHIASPIGPSKCSMVGAEYGNSGAPDWWWDNARRWLSIGSLPRPFDTSSPNWHACAEPLEVALAYCTDAPGDGSLLGDFRSRRLSYSPSYTDSCGSPSGYIYTWGTALWRGTRFLIENEGADGSWLYPLADSYDYTVTTSPGADPCSDPQSFRTSRDSLIERVLGFPGLPSYRYWFGPGAEVPRWGMTERTSYWGNDCYTATHRLPNDVTSAVEYPSARGPNCRIRELQYVRSCPSGFRATAGGECSATSGPAPAMVFLNSGRGD